MDEQYVERAFFVSFRDVSSGLYPDADPVILIDAALAHLHDEVRLIEVVDAPADAIEFIGMSGLRPLLPIDSREAVLFNDAQFAAVVSDRRSRIDEMLEDASRPRLHLGSVS